VAGYGGYGCRRPGDQHLELETVWQLQLHMWLDISRYSDTGGISQRYTPGGGGCIYICSYIYCWRVGFPVCCFPPCGFSPRGVWGLCPLRSSDDAVSMILLPHPEPTSGCCSEPDSGWQSAAARPGTTLSVPTPGRPPDHHHGCGTWPAAAEQCSKQDDQGLPTT